MTDRELMQQALDALDLHAKQYPHMVKGYTADAAEALRAALAQPEQEPVAWWHDMGDVVDLNVSGRGIPLYTAPPQREWQGLTDEEIVKLQHLIDWTAHWSYGNFARAIEARLKEKNNG